MAPFWPVVLKQDNLILRPLRFRDKRAWTKLRLDNQSWLKQWEATIPDEFNEGIASFYQLLRNLKDEANSQRALPFVLTIDNKIAGQITVANINYGSTRSAYVGYWIGQEFAGNGYTPLAVAMAIDHCFEVLKLHRVEITIRPENIKSIRVVEKLGLRSEGLRPKFLHIDGEWRDHLVFAINEDEISDSLVSKLKNS